MTLRHFPLVSVPAERAQHKATVGRSAQGEGRRAAVDPSKGWPDNAAAGGYCCALTVATVSPHARLLRSFSECETQRGQLDREGSEAKWVGNNELLFFFDERNIV